MDTLGRRYELLRPHLNELQRRLWLGVEARRSWVSAGWGSWRRRPVLQRTRCVGAARRSTAGRLASPAARVSPVVAASVPSSATSKLVAALEELIAPSTRGDPMSPLRWTCKSTRSLAAALTQAGHTVSDFVVRRLLHQLGYSLQANVKTTEGFPLRTGTRSSATSTTKPASIWSSVTR